MGERGLIAYDPQGRVFVLGHEDMLLVHDGESEAPLWDASIGDVVVGVAIAGDEIVAVGEDGELHRFTFLNRVLQRVSLGGPVRTFAVHRDGTVAAAHEHHVSRLGRNDLAPAVLWQGRATALAWSRDGKTLLVGESGSRDTHRLVLLDAAGTELGTAPQPLTSTIGAIASTPRGFLVASGDAVARFSQPGVAPARVTHAAGRVITDLASSADGARLALQIERSWVVVLADPPAETLLDVSYPERVCTGVAFGPRPWLAIGLAGGDANKIHVDTGAVHRSDPHAGRPRNRGMLQVGGAFEAAASKPAPPALGPEELERQRQAQRALAQLEVELRKNQHSDAERAQWVRVGLVVLALAIGLLRACAHHF
ncbi:MAG: WD40 repeat domain-containing protein [Deltaproteobacteria bacterium]